MRFGIKYPKFWYKITWFASDWRCGCSRKISYSMMSMRIINCASDFGWAGDFDFDFGTGTDYGNFGTGFEKVMIIFRLIIGFLSIEHYEASSNTSHMITVRQIDWS